MTLQEVKSVVNEVFPLIEKKYGYSKFFETTPYVEYSTSIYARLSGEEDDGTTGEENPDAEFDSLDNYIVLYYPKMENREHVIQTLVHEYQHYLQSPLWMKRYYNMGYNYNDHPYEVAAYAEEKNWNKIFE